ncbi:MAG: hypothetical protein K2Z81_15840 [Cyanobacteria bacterium]|nr:hypothetical protein [Cyanobacteriota bacterium]
MSLYQGLESIPTFSDATGLQDTESQNASEKLLASANESECRGCSSQWSDRDKAERAANQIMGIMDKQNSATVSAFPTAEGLRVNVDIGAETAQANKLVDEMNKAGYPLKVMFGPNFDRESDIAAYESAQPTPGMTKMQAVQVLQQFFNHADSFHHREDIVKSWNYVRCHPSNDPVSCPDGPISSAFRSAYMELSGYPGELNARDYAKLNSALKVLESYGDKVSVHFE